MSSQRKRQYRKTRSRFTYAVKMRVRENPALGMLILETRAAWHHRRHIGQIWAMFRNPAYKDFRDDYSRHLFGKSLTGRSDIWRSLRVGAPDLFDTYYGKIPERFAMGDAYGAALRELNHQQREQLNQRNGA